MLLAFIVHAMARKMRAIKQTNILRYLKRQLLSITKSRKYIVGRVNLFSCIAKLSLINSNWESFAKNFAYCKRPHQYAQWDKIALIFVSTCKFSRKPIKSLRYFWCHFWGTKRCRGKNKQNALDPASCFQWVTLGNIQWNLYTYQLKVTHFREL